MILDTTTLLSDDQAITTGTAYSDVIKVAAAAVTTSADAPSGVGEDSAKGIPLALLAQVTTQFTTSNGGTLTTTLQTATDEAFTSPVDLAASAAIAAAALTPGKMLLPQTVPYGVLGYLRLKYVVANTMTAGKVTAGIGSALQSNK